MTQNSAACSLTLPITYDLVSSILPITASFHSARLPVQTQSFFSVELLLSAEYMQES